MVSTTFNESINNTSQTDGQVDGAFVYYYGIFCLITCVNLPGNLLVIITFLKHDNLREPCNYFLISLAVNDLFTGIIYPMYNISHIDDENIQNILGNWTMCKFLVVEIDVLWGNSSFHLLAITVTRFICITKPLRCHQIITKTNSVIAIASLWILMHVIKGCVLGIYDKPEKFNNRCMFDAIYPPAYTHFIFITNFIIPIAAMIGLYGKIISIARQQSKVMAVMERSVGQHGPSEGNVARELKAVIMVGFLLLCFCVAWLPLITYIYIQTICKGCIKAPFLRATVRILLYVNSATNVFVYAGRFAPFRNAVKKDLKRMSTACTGH